MRTFVAFVTGAAKPWVRLIVPVVTSVSLSAAAKFAGLESWATAILLLAIFLAVLFLWHGVRLQGQVDSLPRLVFSDPRSAHRLIRVGNPPHMAYVASIGIANSPKSQRNTARVTDLVASLEFFSTEGDSLFEVDGAWSDGNFEPRDLPPNGKHLDLDVAFKDALEVDSYGIGAPTPEDAGKIWDDVKRDGRKLSQAVQFCHVSVSGVGGKADQWLQVQNGAREWVLGVELVVTKCDPPGWSKPQKSWLRLRSVS